MLVCGSEGQRYKRRWTLRTASAKTVQVSIEERNLTEPGWERSRISRRSLGWVKEGGPRGGSGLEMVGCGTVRSGSTLDLGLSLVLEVVGSVNMAPGWGAGVVSGRRVIGRGGVELWMRGALASVLRCSKLCNMGRSDGIAWPFSNQHLESRQMVVLKRGCIARVPSHASHGGGDAKTYGESGEIQGPCSFARPGCKRAVCTHVPPHNPAADVYMR